MSEWKEYKLKEVVSFIDYRGKTPNKKTFGVPLITAKIVKNGVIQEPTEFISFEDYKGWMTRGFPQVGDVVMTTEAPLGEVAQIKDASFALAQRIITMRGKEGLLNSGYLKYFLQSNIGQARLKERETGTTVTGIKSSELKEVLVSAPDYKVQTAIAEILSSLDDKIELNNQINKDLEALAQALFKQWFIDFEFPNENGEPYRSSGGEMVDSELGEIPKGWNVDSIYRIAEVINGAPFKSSMFNQEKKGLPLIRIRDLKTNKPQFWTDEKHPKGSIIKPGDLIVGMDAEFRPHFWLGQNAWLNQRLCQFKAKKGFSRLFVREIIRPQLAFFENSSVGTTVIHLGKGDIDSFKSVIPPDYILQKFELASEPIIENIVINALENDSLKDLRDTLLPKLISGELEVSDIQTNTL